MRMILANKKRVEVSQEEADEFITQLLIPNPDWHHSGLLSEGEVMRFLKGRSNQEKLKKIAWYILTYTENLAFTGYLFDKADGEPERTKEFNLPSIKKLRELYQEVNDNGHTMMELSRIVNEMEGICLEIGATRYDRARTSLPRTDQVSAVPHVR